jgi:hypothetical protein
VHGEFSARYDARAPGPLALGALERLLYAPASARPDASLVHEAVFELADMHAEERVALCLRPELIHAFAEDALWPGERGAAKLSVPARGAACHVVALGGKATLLDYGVGASGG